MKHLFVVFFCIQTNQSVKKDLSFRDSVLGTKIKIHKKSFITVFKSFLYDYNQLWSIKKDFILLENITAIVN